MTPEELRQRTAAFAKAVRQFAAPLLASLVSRDPALQLMRAASSVAANYRDASAIARRIHIQDRHRCRGVGRNRLLARAPAWLRPGQRFGARGPASRVQGTGRDLYFVGNDRPRQGTRAPSQKL